MNYTIDSNELFDESDLAGKTIFTFNDEKGDKSTLTLDKYVADALPKHVGGDVHAWIQIQYDGIIAGKECFARYISVFKKRGKELSRRTIGDIIRTVAMTLVVSNFDDSEW